MRRWTLGLILLLTFVASPGVLAEAATPASGATDALAPAVSENEAVPADPLAADLLAPAPVELACVDLYCEWRDRCYNEPGGWSTTYKAKYCFTNCGYFWYYTGQNCCYTTQPGSC